MPDDVDTGPTTRPTVVAIIGATGFVGGAVAANLGDQAVAVRPVRAPRLAWPAPPWPAAHFPEHSALQGAHAKAQPAAPAIDDDAIDRLAASLAGAQVVINAAGLPDGRARAGESLYGANALLPKLVALACARAGVNRYIHVSSAAVQGRLALDETERTRPFSPYSHAKALGEQLLLRQDAIVPIIFRATWVHDAGRANTESLVRLARSRYSCVAGDGTQPTPQVLIGELARSLAWLALTDRQPPPVVLTPYNGMTTAQLLRLLGGREPRHLSLRVAHTMAGAARALSRINERANAVARRADMLLFGKVQATSWLTRQGLAATVDETAWKALGGAGSPSPATVHQQHSAVPAGSGVDGR